MIPANHDHIRQIYLNAKAEEERHEAIQFLCVLSAALVLFCISIGCVVAHFWR